MAGTKIGYMVKAGIEPIKSMMGWYSLDTLPKNQSQLNKDIDDVFRNLKPKTATVYEVRLVKVAVKKK